MKTPKSFDKSAKSFPVRHNPSKWHPLISMILSHPDREYSRFLWLLFQDQVTQNKMNESDQEIRFFQLVYHFLYKKDVQEALHHLDRCEEIQDWPIPRGLSIRLIGLILRDQFRFQQEYELLSTFLKLKNASKDCIVCEVLWRRLEKQIFLRMKTCTHSKGMNRLIVFDSLLASDHDFELELLQSIAYDA